jgi:hypothetical protein
MRYKDFFSELCCEGCGCDHSNNEEYPFSGYKITQADIDADEKTVHSVGEYKKQHKRRDPMGQEDADVNNDGKIDLTDKMLRAKRDLYRRYLIAKKKGQTSF